MLFQTSFIIYILLEFYKVRMNFLIKFETNLFILTELKILISFSCGTFYNVIQLVLQ
jgi:hypothetical protein